MKAKYGFTLILLLALSCGRQEETESSWVKGSCSMIEDQGVCVDFKKGFRSYEIKDLCEEKNGFYSKLPCDPEGVVAVCDSDYLGREGTKNYYETHFTRLQARLNCAEQAEQNTQVKWQIQYR